MDSFQLLAIINKAAMNIVECPHYELELLLGICPKEVLRDLPVLLYSIF